MENLTSTNSNRPKSVIIFYIIGAFYIAGAVIPILTGGIGSIFSYYTNKLYQHPEATIFISFAHLGLLTMPVLSLISGIGLFKLKQWLPKLLLITIIIGSIFQINNYLAFPQNFNIESTLIKDINSLIISIVIIIYVNSKKQLFNNQ